LVRRDAWAVAVVAFVVGCVELGQASLWLDEALSIDLAQRPLPYFVGKLVTTEANQSLYFVLLRIWPLHGLDEVGPRLLSVLFTAAAAVLLSDLGRRLYDRMTGIVAALLLAVLPFALQATQEARGYSLLMAMTVASGWTLVRADSDGGRWWVMFGATAGLLAYTHLFGLFIVGGQVLWGLVAVSDRRRLLMATGLGAVVATPAVVHFLHRGPGQLWYLTGPDPGSTMRALADFGAGRPLVGAMLLGLAVVGAAAGFVRSRRATALPVFWILVGTVPPIVYSLLVTPIVQYRYIVGVVPVLALLMAVAVAMIPFARVRIGVAIALIGLLLVLIPGGFGPLLREDWRSAVASVNEGFRPGDQVIAAPFFEAAGVNAYRSPAYPPLPEAVVEPVADRVWVVGRTLPAIPAGYAVAHAATFQNVYVTLLVRSAATR
jgi:mannosyltransferase